MHTGKQMGKCVGFRANNIIVHYGEIGLKGRNRATFEQRLQGNIARRLASEGLDWPVHKARGYLFVKVPVAATAGCEAALQALRMTPGVVWAAPAHWLPRSAVVGEADLPAIEAPLLELARADWRPGARFRMRVKRGDKRFPLSSTDLQKRFGATVLRETSWDRVDLEEPDHVFHVDLYADSIYVYGNRVAGVGGLPVGTTGHVLVLLSGGIDSPVAAYLMAKRGCSVDFIHFSATMTQQRDAGTGKIARIARHLSRVTQRSRLYVVPYQPFELATLTARSRYELIVFRRFMAATAQRLAQDVGAQALVTGDSLGQVASQTMENIVSISRSVEMPILRPLLTYDKQEIIDLARRLGTYEASIEPYKDCCSLLSQNPKTVSRHTRLRALEARILPEYAPLIEETLGQCVRLDFDYGRDAG